MSKLSVVSSIKINASANRVWQALVDPEQTKVYMFGCETVSDWKIGSPLLWRGNIEGNEMVFVKGFIIDIQPYALLKYSVIDPNAPYPDIPVNHLNVTYSLEEENGYTTLTVIQDGFETAADGENRYKDVYNNGEGWNPILKAIREMIEG